MEACAILDKSSRSGLSQEETESLFVVRLRWSIADSNVWGLAGKEDFYLWGLVPRFPCP